MAKNDAGTAVAEKPTTTKKKAAKKGSTKAAPKTTKPKVETTKAAPKTTKPKVETPAPEVEVTARSVVEQFNPNAKGAAGDWGKWRQSKTVKDQLGTRLAVNETGLYVNVDGSEKANIQSVTDFLAAFNLNSTLWDATSAYGLQHFNNHGFMHRGGLMGRSNDAISKLVAQSIDELAQRASLAGKGDESADEAADMLNVLLAWGAKRVNQVKADKKAQAYEVVEADGETVLQQK